MEAGFFPLDEELDLPSSGLTPHAHQGLVLLGSLLPFASAAKHLHILLHVQVSKSTVRRLTEQAGACLHQWQDLQAHPLSEDIEPQVGACRLVMATDGVLIPVRPNEWAEVKMTTIGEIGQGQHEEPHSEQLSYFARLAEAETFADLASCEMCRRGVAQAEAVAALQDGAEWIQGFVQSHRADVVRILDFAHAAQYISEVGVLAQSAGVCLSPRWLTEQLHEIKQQGPRAVLREGERLSGLAPSEEIREKMAYLREREVEVLRLVATGKSNRQIGEMLVISERTVINHIVSIFNKTGVSNRAGATALAIRHKLVE